MSSWMLPAVLSTWITRLQNMVDRRLRDLFPAVFHGLLFTMEARRTCTSWFRAGGISSEFRRAYRVIGFTGRHVQPMAMSVLYDIANLRMAAGVLRIRLALLTEILLPNATAPMWKERGIHHNPTPGPANHAFLYGHSLCDSGLDGRAPAVGEHAPCRRPAPELYVRQKLTCRRFPRSGGRSSAPS